MSRLGTPLTSCGRERVVEAGTTMTGSRELTPADTAAAAAP
jgi:hypothetical protein